MSTNVGVRCGVMGAVVVRAGGAVRMRAWACDCSCARNANQMVGRGATESPLEAAMAATESPPSKVRDADSTNVTFFAQERLACHQVTWL